MSRTDTLPPLVHPTAHLGSAGLLARTAVIGVFLVSLLVGLAVLLEFYDRYWWSPDEGAYAHVAERILQGEVLNGSVQDIHMGYVNFANALAFKVFGLELLSLRYPLMALTLIGCALMFWLLAGRGALVAFTGAVVFSSLTFVQFLNPTAHWYALFFCLLIITYLSTDRREGFLGLELLGFLIVTLFLFRQLSGVLTAMGVLTFLLLQDQRPAGQGGTLLARLLAGIMVAGLVFYLGTKTDLFAAVVFGGPPLALLIYAGMTTRLSDRCVLQLALRMGLGGVVALSPLLAYHMMHGSLGSWWDDTVMAALRLTDLPFMEFPGYSVFTVMGLAQVLQAGSFTGVVNGAFWLVVPLLPVFLGLCLLVTLRRGDAAGRAALPVVACFFALVSVHYQVPIYLFFSSALTLAAILYLGGNGGKTLRYAVTALGLGLSVIGLQYHAGQPLNRGLDGALAGRNDIPMMPAGLVRANLNLPIEEGALFRYLVAVIQERTKDDDYILALPANPELYFLAERRNPLRFFNAALGMRSEADLRAAEAALAERRPRIVFYRTEDKYNTPLVRQLMQTLRGEYVLYDIREGFEIYFLKDQIWSKD